MLHLQNIHLNYATDKSRLTPILQSVDLHVEGGQVVVVLGPNGAGKSSLLKVACGEVTPQSGEVHFNRRLLSSLSAAEKALHMAVLPQNSLLNFPFTAEEVVMLGRTPHDTGLVLDQDIVAQALHSTDVHYLRQQAYTNLSGGEKQRVQLARVLAQVWQSEDDWQRLVVLDEPTSALDYSHQQMVARLLRERAAEGCGVLTAMHDLNLAAHCADQLVLMCCGQIRAVGTPDEVLQEALLKEVFQVEFHRVTHPETGRPWLLC
ncbi:heme ABC transporter ATP-binding protein [Aestuariicella hydrocarbonica]|uniref:Heme ABC transporter ATP-binding protein n=1 Tax=Pseudomaricurvus hydrocarbonicus TaxID=1470433 RepID=A0A9E5JTD9_9GAMM|nr:heme ABC transporter ATP-binding protein [Aestuariicella hydrocarbonica]NHO64260.1 heme ABC transporter ATP-binding protein [Aestuariicella hydrocarbonica]